MFKQNTTRHIRVCGCCLAQGPDAPKGSTISGGLPGVQLCVYSRAERNGVAAWPGGEVAPMLREPKAGLSYLAV